MKFLEKIKGIAANTSVKDLADQGINIETEMQRLSDISDAMGFGPFYYLTIIRMHIDDDDVNIYVQEEEDPYFIPLTIINAVDPMTEAVRYRLNEEIRVAQRDVDNAEDTLRYRRQSLYRAKLELDTFELKNPR